MHRDAEWRVTWFPPEQKQVQRRGSESVVRALARDHAQWHPIIESRYVVVTDWQMVDESGPTHQ